MAQAPPASASAERTATGVASEQFIAVGCRDDHPRRDASCRRAITGAHARMSMLERRTKIVATLGPATDSPGVLDRLVAAGLDCARLNCSHGTHDDLRRRAVDVRAAVRRARRPLGLLFDLQGPKLRLSQTTLTPTRRGRSRCSRPTQAGGDRRRPSPIEAAAQRCGGQVAQSNVSGIAASRRSFSSHSGLMCRPITGRRAVA